MLHGAGIFTYSLVIFGVNVAKYSSTMEHLGLDISMDKPETLDFPMISMGFPV
jgi:hypothetical protein